MWPSLGTADKRINKALLSGAFGLFQFVHHICFTIGSTFPAEYPTMTCAIVWFQRDLRLTDNPALHAALSQCERIIPLYIHAPAEEQPWIPGAASRWWLLQSLVDLDHQLRTRGSRLLIRQGPSLQALQTLIQEQQVTHLFWNRLYDPSLFARNADIEQQLEETGLVCQSFNAALLFEPWEIASGSGLPYRVFSAYWRACLSRLNTTQAPLPAADTLPPLPDALPGLQPDDLDLQPKIPWHGGLAAHWTPGEDGALQRLQRFIDESLHDYDGAREIPGITGTSGLSPHLHFGEIGPRQIIHRLRLCGDGGMDMSGQAGAASYLRELGWREFAHHLIHHFPQTQLAPLNPRFEKFPWAWGEQRPELLTAWQRGETGIPIVDAGIRELWHTGWMHNRVRMIVASLLTKNFGIHWVEGARWFWDTLVDADLANNTLGWQWTAGCGADAAPFFRIFNPLRQGERFDPRGEYVRRWVPTLAKLPDSHIHAPWLANSRLLSASGVTLGKDYPLPRVDLKHSREQALDNWNSIK
jgi:deoxyribodipyrimidine photo-lyase